MLRLGIIAISVLALSWPLLVKADDQARDENVEILPLQVPGVDDLAVAITQLIADTQINQSNATRWHKLLLEGQGQLIPYEQGARDAAMVLRDAYFALPEQRKQKLATFWDPAAQGALERAYQLENEDEALQKLQSIFLSWPGTAAADEALDVVCTLLLELNKRDELARMVWHAGDQVAALSDSLKKQMATVFAESGFVTLIAQGLKIKDPELLAQAKQASARLLGDDQGRLSRVYPPQNHGPAPEFGDLALRYAADSEGPRLIPESKSFLESSRIDSHLVRPDTHPIVWKNWVLSPGRRALRAIDRKTGKLKWEFSNTRRSQGDDGVPFEKAIPIDNNRPYAMTRHQSFLFVPFVVRDPEQYTRQGGSQFSYFIRTAAHDVACFNLDMIAAGAEPQPLYWLGETLRKSQGQDFSLIQPPVVVDDRIFVAHTRFQGTLINGVSCFALKDGRLLWHRDLASSQQEMNYFGRETRESIPGRMVYSDGRLYTCSNMGVVACLESDGRIQWVSRYQQIPTMVPVQYKPTIQKKLGDFAHNPPLIFKQRVVFAPTDSVHLLAFDPLNGQAIWKQPFPRRARRMVTESDAFRKPYSREAPSLDDALYRTVLCTQEDRLFSIGEDFYEIDPQSGELLFQQSLTEQNRPMAARGWRDGSQYHYVCQKHWVVLSLDDGSLQDIPLSDEHFPEMWPAVNLVADQGRWLGSGFLSEEGDPKLRSGERPLFVPSNRESQYIEREPRLVAWEAALSQKIEE